MVGVFNEGGVTKKRLIQGTESKNLKICLEVDFYTGYWRVFC